MVDALEYEIELDIFIVLSFATPYVGISGQFSYSAANHYMSSLVRSQRARGLAGSVVVIGFLTGLGYIYRSDPKHLTAIEKSLLSRLDRQGETDLHDMLFKAIAYGRPDSSQPPELLTGMRRTLTEPWHEDPRLSGYLVPEGADDKVDGQDQAEGNVKVEVSLAAIENPKEALAVPIKCFSKVLGNVLQLEPAQISSDMPVAEHGVDLLVSVRLREWFLKGIGVEVPVSKLMSTNHTLLRLCEDALASRRQLRTGTTDVRDVVPEFVTKAYAHDSREASGVHNYCSENRCLLSDLVSMYKARLGGKIDVLPTKE